MSGGHVEVVDFFLEHARSNGGEEGLQAVIKNCCTCLPDPSVMYHAILHNSLPMIECIVEKAGKESTLYSRITNGRGASFYPTHLAACNGKLSIVKWLFSQGVPVNLVTPTSNCTALHYVCSRIAGDEEKMLEVVRFLVEDIHANIHIRNIAGDTAEDIAHGRGDHRIAAYLKGRRTVEARQAQRAEAADKAAAATQSEEQIRQAAAAADEAAVRLLEDLEAEEQASVSPAESSSTTKKNKNKKKKGRQVVVLAA
jgi:hypothetical protein